MVRPWPTTRTRCQPWTGCACAGRATGEPKGADDAAEARAFPRDALPSPLCFDHGTILADYLRYRRTGQRRKL